MSSIVKVDTIQENTSANGITVDGLNIKDSKLVTANSVVAANITADAIDATKIANNAISEEHLDVTSITGHTAETSIADGDTILIHDASASALRKMTKANFVSGIGGANTPAFLAYVNSSTQTIANNATVKITNYNAEEFDTDNAFTGGQFTIPSGGAGRYVFHANVSTDDAAAVTNKQFNIQIKAGSTTISSNTILKAPYTQFGISAMADLSEGTVISMHMYQDSGSTVNLEGNRRTFFGGFKLI
jgi:hypothetical protein